MLVFRKWPSQLYLVFACVWDSPAIFLKRDARRLLYSWLAFPACSLAPGVSKTSAASAIPCGCLSVFCLRPRFFCRRDFRLWFHVWLGCFREFSLKPGFSKTSAFSAIPCVCLCCGFACGFSGGSGRPRCQYVRTHGRILMAIIDIVRFYGKGPVA